MVENKRFAKFKFRETAILCDQVRREDNGKLILIGVYGGDILVDSYPATLGLTAYVEGEVLEPGFFEAEFQFIDGTGAEMSPELKVTSGDRQFVRGHFAVPVVAVLTFHKSGNCVFRVKDGDKWKTLLTKSIKLKKEIVASELAK